MSGLQGQKQDHALTGLFTGRLTPPWHPGCHRSPTCREAVASGWHILNHSCPTFSRISPLLNFIRHLFSTDFVSSRRPVYSAEGMACEDDWSFLFRNVMENVKGSCNLKRKSEQEPTRWKSHKFIWSNQSNTNSVGEKKQQPKSKKHLAYKFFKTNVNTHKLKLIDSNR